MELAEAWGQEPYWSSRRARLPDQCRENLPLGETWVTRDYQLLRSPQVWAAWVSSVQHSRQEHWWWQRLLSLQLTQRNWSNLYRWERRSSLWRAKSSWTSWVKANFVFCYDLICIYTYEVIPQRDLPLSTLLSLCMINLSRLHSVLSIIISLLNDYAFFNQFLLLFSLS